MWSKIILCALIGFAAAAQNGWQSNMEYEYEVHGRTFTAMHDIANQYSGIVLKAKLIIHPENEENLMAKIVNAQYSQVHANLPEGWRSDIDERHLQYKQLELSEKPFQILLKKGVIHDVIVDRQVANWKANIIKAIVSQVQLDIYGEHVIKAHLNQLPEDDSNSAVFKTMEDTISGTYETLYDISALPEYVWQSQPELVPMPELQKDGEIIEIVKTKNYSRSEERLGYYYGFGASGRFEPMTNQMGDFFLRSGVSRVIVSGNLHRYTIQSATSTNKIIVSPTLNSEQKGMVVSHLNLTLADMKPAQGHFEQPQQGQKLGSLTYTFNTPFSDNYEARQGAQRRQQEYMYSSEEQDGQYYNQHNRRQRSIQRGDESVESEEEWAQEEAKLNQPPQSPLLPFFIGYKGKSVKYSDKVNVVEVAIKLAQEISKDIQNPEKMPKEQTLAKFVVLSSVARIMNEHEMAQVTQNLYVNEPSGQKVTAWWVYADAIAESGTGPALLTVKEWIKSKKIQRQEAAEIVANLAESVRQPTEEFMQTFYELCYMDEQVKHQYALNDTAILSYARLARKVYVDKIASHNQYPVHSFGKFRTEQGQQFVAQKLIPYLTEQLHQAVRSADSHKILVYIRALGFVGHQKILEAFEPYLEGDKQCSQFQRLQMVVALDKLVKVHPKVARSVLYKIYQNAGEQQELRVAAVYQLIRTAPPASMLQRMAQYTNVDTDEQVNAAVKSSIESAAQLEGAEFSELRDNARAAEPLLTKDNYGFDYSSNYLRSYVANELNMYYKQTYQTYGSQDSFFPQGFKYALRTGMGGVRRQVLIAQAMVSSIDELTNVFQMQTAQYQQNQQQQQHGYQQAKQQKWSSEYIADKLNYDQEEREQLEGSLLLQLYGGANHFFAFNNQTIEMLPHFLQQIEEHLRSGEKFQYTKMVNRYEMSIAFPTEMALPFIYTLDTPTMFHVSGKVQGTAEPKMCNGQVIRSPEMIRAQAEIHAVVSSKMQTKMGFITPFDFQHYIAGYDKNTHINVPIKSQYEIDLKEKQFHAQFQPIEHDQDVTVVHYSTWPYTAIHNIMQFEPVCHGSHVKTIYADDQPQTQWNTLIGKETGIAFRVNYVSEQKFFDYMWFYEQLQRNDGVTALLAPRYDETVQHVQLNVQYAAQQSSARTVHVRFGYESYDEQEEGHGNFEINQFSHLPREYKSRQQQFAKWASAGIASSHADVYDFAVEFEGQQKAEYTATIAAASSPVAEKSRFLFYYRKHAAKSYEVAVSGMANIPNTNGLDYSYALSFDPSTTAQAEFAFGQDLKSATKFSVNAKLHQSEERKQYLKDSSRAHECYEEMKQGNKQLPACANMTAEANLLDRVKVNVEFQHLSPQLRNATYKIYNQLRYLSRYNIDENVVDAQTNENDNQMSFQARFEPDFEAVNVTIWTQNMESHIDNVRMNEWAQQVFGFHPVFRWYDRVMSYALEYDTYRPYCIVDQSAANTFDNNTYELDLGQDWTVMMHYAPQFARYNRQQYQQQQQEYQQEHYAVVVRDDQSSKYKEVKVTIRTQETQGQIMEFHFKPRGHCGDNQPCAQVFYNGNEVQYNDQQVYEVLQGFVQIYALPNGEMKWEVEDAFYIIYDGERVKLTPTHDKFRGAVRGLCGTYDGEPTTDFLAPANCIYQEAEDFIASYQLEQGLGQSQRQGRYSYKKGQEQQRCVKQEIEYANVISNQDAGRQQQRYHQRYNQHSGNLYRQRNNQQHQDNGHYRRDGDEDSCMYHQSRYEYDQYDNKVCFSIHPLPVCRKHCNAERVIEKNVPVHCVAKSSMTQSWQHQIDNGASPDFSEKSATKSMKMQVHESCSKY